MRWKQLTGAAVLAASLILGAATADAGYGSGDWGGPLSAIQDPGWANPDLQVGWIGDSISYGCASYIRAALPGVAVRAQSGQNWAGSMDWAQSLSYKPKKVVLELGTNDLFNPPAVPAQIARAKAIFPNSEIVVIDTWAARKSQPASVQINDAANTAWVNQFLRAGFPEDHVADWYASVRGAMNRGGWPLVDSYLADGTHPSSTGATGCNYYVASVMPTINAAFR